MTDNIIRILANAKEVFKVKNNNLSCVIITDDENGKEANYTFNFNYDGITVGRTVVDDNKIKVISNTYEYDIGIFYFVLDNFYTLMGDINEFNNTVNFTLNNIPAMVFSNSVFRKEAYDGKEIYDGDKYIDDFIAYNNSNILINNTNYFTFLKIAVEAGNIEIFDYLRFTYNEYMNNLSEKQMAILIYTACKRNPAFIEKMHELDFTFGFELLKLAVDNNDYEVLEYFYNENININIANRNNETILDYAITKNNIEMIKYLLTIKDINIRENIILGIRQNPEVIKTLFKRDDITNILNIRTPSGRSVAHAIAENENLEVVKLLFEREDIDNILRMTNGNGWSVANEIAGNENLEVVKLLFERKNIGDILRMGYRYGWSIAHIIAENKNPEVIKFLFEREDIGDILRIRDENGFFVAHDIANNENPEIVKLLFKREDIGDILRMTNRYGHSVAHAVAENENPEVVKLLFERPEIIKNILKRKNRRGLTVTSIMAKNKNPKVIESLLICENVELEKKDIDSIKKNFSNNEEIMNLLAKYELINTNNAVEEVSAIVENKTTKKVSVITENETKTSEKVSVITKNEAPEEMNTCKMCTIC